MHRLIQDMGRQIIQHESQEPGERSRLWNPRDAFGVLKDETGTRTVEGLTLDMRRVEEARENTKKRRYKESQEPGERSRLWNPRDAFGVLKDETGTRTVEGLTLDMRRVEEARENTKKRRYKEFYDSSIISNHFSSIKKRCLSFITGQSRNTTLTSQSSICLRTNAFESMKNLRLLELKYVKLTGSYGHFPKSIVWLSWHGFPQKVIPMEFQMEKLVVLDLRYSKLEHVWNKTPFLESLKILDLSYSEWLERTPNFLGLPSLENLILKGCVSLIEVCESIGNLEMLESLDLSDCRTLKKLPRNIGRLGSLRNLVISGCNISELPSELRNIKSLEVLNAAGNDINPLLEVKWWKPFVLSMVPRLKKGPNTLWASLPCSLQHLNLSRCNLSDESFPENLGNLPSLYNLNLSQNLFRRLTNCVKNLSGLWPLDIRECNLLKSLDLIGLPDKMWNINAMYCISLEKVTSLDGSVVVELCGCSKLYQITNDFKNKVKDIGDRQTIGSLGIVYESAFSNSGSIFWDTDLLRVPHFNLHTCVQRKKCMLQAVSWG